MLLFRNTFCFLNRFNKNSTKLLALWLTISWLTPNTFWVQSLLLKIFLKCLRPSSSIQFRKSISADRLVAVPEARSAHRFALSRAGRWKSLRCLWNDSGYILGRLRSVFFLSKLLICLWSCDLPVFPAGGGVVQFHMEEKFLIEVANVLCLIQVLLLIQVKDSNWSLWKRLHQT